MGYKAPNIYAALKLEGHSILGRVITISDGELVFQSISDEEIKLESFLHIDIFTSGQMYFRDIPVKIISDKKIKDDLSFFNLLTREIKVQFNESEITDLISKIKG